VTDYLLGDIAAFHFRISLWFCAFSLSFISFGHLSYRRFLHLAILYTFLRGPLISSTSGNFCFFLLGPARLVRIMRALLELFPESFWSKEAHLEHALRYLIGLPL